MRLRVMAFVIIAILVGGFAGGSSAFASTESEIKKLSQKIDKLLKTQQTIIATLNELKGEMQIIKIRASRS